MQTADVITTRCTFWYHTSPCSHQGKLPLPPPLPFCIRVISPLIFLYKNYKFCWIQRGLDKIHIESLSFLYLASVSLSCPLPYLVLGAVPLRPTNNWTCCWVKPLKFCINRLFKWNLKSCVTCSYSSITKFQLFYYCNSFSNAVK